MQWDDQKQTLVGPGGSLPVRPEDEITRKLAMLIAGECEGLGPVRAAEKFGFSKQRYFQLRQAFQEHGAAALQSQRRGPKSHYRRTEEVVRQVIRHRFLDPEASAPVIGQKLRQAGQPVSTRSVERVITDYGLQKKLYECRPRPAGAGEIETQATWQCTQKRPCDPASLERGVRQGLADQVQGNLLGLWLLVPEHLRLGELVCGWDANHLAKDFFRGLEGDVRVQKDTVIVTYYNAPHASQLRAQYENLPHRLRQENINPQLPWLYGFKLDFRFR